MKFITDVCFVSVYVHGSLCILYDFLMYLQYVTRYSRKSLRVLGSVGEPINPTAWRFVMIPGSKIIIYSKGLTFSFVHFRWFYDIIGDARCPISDTWWQTETGGFMVIMSLHI